MPNQPNLNNPRTKVKSFRIDTKTWDALHEIPGLDDKLRALCFKELEKYQSKVKKRV